MVCDFFYPRLGGVELHIWSLAQCLMKRGHRVVVVTHAYDGSRRGGTSRGGDGNGNGGGDEVEENEDSAYAHDDNDGHRRVGVRYMSNGLKVYYLPLVPMVDEDAFPTFYAWFPLFRNVLIREDVTIVHGHQATSCMTNEAILFARTLGFRACYTDHSLFGFADAGSIHINKVLQCCLSDLDAAICVSHTCRENLVLRTGLPPQVVYTIPNAVDPARFTPDLERWRRRRGRRRRKRRIERPEKSASASSGGTRHRDQQQQGNQQEGEEEEEEEDDDDDDAAGDFEAEDDEDEGEEDGKGPERVVVVVVSRLVHRKGTDLLARVIPRVCAALPQVDFLVGGDGPKKLLLEEMRERHQLMGRVKLLGGVPHDRVRDLLVRGDIFLNCSLTESFCIAVVEAACCGLFVVSTAVGGVPEVLPESM